MRIFGGKTTRPAPAESHIAKAEAERIRAALLLESDLFRGLQPEEMDQIAGRLPMATCRPGQLIYEPGATGEALFVLKAGRVRLYRITPDGRKLVLMTIGPGTVFGDMSVLGQSMVGSFAEAVESSVLCVMSRVDIESVILEHPRVALRMIQLLSRRLEDAERRLEQLAFAPVPARLARLLLELEHEGVIQGYSHQDLAEMVGASRETVSRALVEFKTAGWVEIDRRRILLRDRGAIEMTAEAGG